MTGKAGSMTWNSTALTMTEANHKVSKTMADSTDSSNYQSATNQLYKSQIPGDLQLTLAVKGWYDSAQTPTTVIAAMQSDAMVVVTTNANASIQIASGNFDVSDWESTVTIPGGTMVDFSCTLMSNGPFVLI
jgi:hypothetical protein